MQCLQSDVDGARIQRIRIGSGRCPDGRFAAAETQRIGYDRRSGHLPAGSGPARHVLGQSDAETGGAASVLLSGNADSMSAGRVQGGVH